MKRSVVAVFMLALSGIGTVLVSAADAGMIGVNVVVRTNITKSILADLGTHGKVRDVVDEIRSVAMQVRSSELKVIQSLPYVAAANPDAVRTGAPIDTVQVEDFASGLNTWDLDAVNVTDLKSGPDRVTSFTGQGVYVAVLDTGLLDSWRQYFPQERIASQFGVSFGGGGGEMGSVSTQPNKWEHDQNSHGTHVTSTILGYSLNGTPFNGVAPRATVIPVKVLNQNGSGWSSVIARGITYVTDLKTSGLLGEAPVVINMSLGGGRLDAMEAAAIDYAVSHGVIIVAAAGNAGTRGMDYPGAYEPVISVAASGWTGEWVGGGTWWYASQVADPTDPGDFYIADFSGRAKSGQDLDVAAPGTWVVGPYQVNSGHTSYYFLGGTSMATPHVAGIVALMAEKNPALTAADAEQILETTAIPLAPGCRMVMGADGVATNVCWEADATGSGLVTADAALDAIE